MPSGFTYKVGPSFGELPKSIDYITTDGYTEDVVPGGEFCPSGPVVEMTWRKAIEDLLDAEWDKACGFDYAAWANA